MTEIYEKITANTAELESLTEREVEVLQLVAECKSTKEIAAQLGIAGTTVDTHRSNVLRKLKLHSVPELIRYAVRHGLVEL